MFRKKVNAVLESKSIIEENEASMVNYGGTYSIFAAAEKSESFMKKEKRYVFVFRIHEKKKELLVDEQTYNKYTEGEAGVLEYDGSQMIQFTVNNGIDWKMNTPAKNYKEQISNSSVSFRNLRYVFNFMYMISVSKSRNNEIG